MLRGLYRFYLYTVFIAMLLFAASGIEGLLQTALSQTLFKDPNTTITTANTVQAIVFAVIALLTAAIFGGLHYWLIRRDTRNDPAAGNGGIRAFFLNAVELVSLPLAVGIGGFTIAGLGQQYSGGASSSVALAITSLAVWAVIEGERRRVPASAGVAHIFQRLHFYGAQLVLLFILTAIWISGVGLLIDDVFFGGRGTGAPVCGGFTVCQGPNLLSQVVGVLLVLAFWLGYGWLSRKDTESMLRRVLHFISFGYGMIALLVGIYRGAALLLLAILHATIDPRSISGPYAPYDIVTPLTLGLLVIAVYLYWLRKSAHQTEEQVAVSLTAQSIATALMGGSFWYGSGLVVLNLLERAIPSNTAVTPESWANAIAFIITGIAYIPLDILLRRRSTHASYTAPLRGFVFALFGGGILTSAIGGATALYAFSTSLFGSPLDNWQYTAHAGLAALAVGVAIVGLYLWVGLREHFFTFSAKQASQSTTAITATTTVPSSSSVAAIVDDLLVGKITRDEAIARIESLEQQRV